jgi:O-antigen/teichoic acid export membrane protein
MFKKIIPRSETSKNILTLITGTTIAQAIPLALSPILTRLYSPEEFGTFALYLSIVAIFGVISTGRYELAIMLPKKNEDAKNILILSISIALVISLLLLLLVFLFNAQIVSLFNNKAISKWLYFIPVSVLLTGVYNTLKSWFNREKKYKIIASNGIIRTSTVGVSNLGFGYGGFNSSGLIIGNVLGLLISVITFTKKIFMSNRYFLHKISRVKINKMARRYIDFPKINLLHSFLDMGRESGIIFILSYFLSTELVGIYFFSANIIKMPLTVISSSISQIFFKKISCCFI